jgi:hypothetical protein
MMSFSLSGGVEIFGFISPSEPTDQYPVIDPLYGIDGLRNVPTTSDLNAIPDLRRRAGMVVGVNDGSTYYRLLPGPWNGTITDWTVFQTGGGSVFTGGTVTGATIFLGGLTATTFSASTYLGLPLDVFVTGGTFDKNTETLTLTRNDNNSIVITGFTDNNKTITGFTYNNNTFTISDNSGSTYSATIDSVTGLTVNGNLISQTISASTYQNLPLDVFVTGGTYSNGALTFTNNSGNTFTINGLFTGQTDVFVTGGTYSNGTLTLVNNTGGTFNVVGFYTGETSYVNSLTTGVGLSANTTTGDITIINTDPDQIVTISGGTGILTGGTYPNFTITNTDPDQVVTISGGTGILTGGTYPNFVITNTDPDQIVTISGGTGILTGGTYPNFTITNTDPDQIVTLTEGSNIDITGTYPNFTIAVTGLTDNDTFTTGFTYNNNTFTLTDNSGSTLSATINEVTGLTINGNLNVTGDTILQSNLTASTINISSTPTINNNENYVLVRNSTTGDIENSSINSLINTNNTVTVALTGSTGVDFNSIKSAVDSITGATSANTYTVKISGGVYYENPFTIPSWVAVVGDSSISTIIQANDSSQTLIYLSDQSAIFDCQVQGCTDTNVSAIVYSSSTTPQSSAISYVENVRFGSNYTHAKVVAYGGANIIMQCSNVKYGGYPFTVGFYATNSGSGIGRMQLRNVTSTNGGIVTTPGLIFAKADAQSCGFIVNGCLLTKAQGAAAGTGFYVENGGFLRLTAVNFQRWSVGIDAPQIGAAPSIDAIALNFENNTIDVNIAHSGATGKIQGTDNFLKTIINQNAPLYEVNQDPKEITVAKKGGDFSSVKSAVDYLIASGNTSITNRYVISVGPGEFYENEIDLTQTPYVSIVGSNIQTTQILPNTNTQHLVKIGQNNEISFLSFSGAPIGYAAIYCYDIGDFGQAHKCSFYDCDTNLWVESVTQDTKFYGEYLDYNGEYEYGTKVIGNNGYLALANLENYFNFPTGSGIVYCNYATGSGATISTFVGDCQTNGVSGSTAFYIQDSAELYASTITVDGFTYGIRNPNIGGSIRFDVDNASFVSGEWDLYVESINTFGTFGGSSSHQKIFTNSPDVYWGFLDIEDGEFDITRKISVTFTDGSHTDLSTLVFEGGSMGLISGGTLTVVSGTTVQADGGFGYLEKSDDSGIVRRIDWTNNLITLSANTDEYIFINENSNLSSSGGRPDTQFNILLGRVVTNSIGVEFIDLSPFDAEHTSNKFGNLFAEALGPIYAFGSIVTEGSTNFTLDVTAGEYHYSTNEFLPAGGTGITFTQYYRNGTGSTWVTSATTLVNNTQYDNNGTLTGLTTGYYTKHTLYVVGDGTYENYFLVLGQDEYSTLVATENALLPTPPSYFTDSVTQIANIYIQEGTSGITQIEDIRPVIGFRAGGVNASSVHGNLLGLNADDHTQYLLVSGTRAMSGNLDMGANNITNVGTVDGVTVSAHATRHQFGGLDQVGTTTPTPNAIPYADVSGTLDSWVSTATTSTLGKVKLSTTPISPSNPIVVGENDLRFLSSFTGGSYSNGTLTLNNISGGTYNINGFYTGATDVFVTGGTYNNTTGTATFTNNTGGTFNVTGFYTGATDVFVTGGTYSNGTATFTNNTGGTFNVFGFYTGATDVFVTGGTYSNGTATFTNNTGGTFNVTGFYTGATDVFVTGGTYNNTTGIATFTNNTGGTFNVVGFYTGGTDYYVTGGTFSSGTLTLDRQNGSVLVTGFTDYYVTGFTYNNANTLTISQNNNQVPLSVLINTMTGLTVTGDLTTTNLHTQYIFDKNDNPGTLGQILVNTATGVEWTTFDFDCDLNNTTTNGLEYKQIDTITGFTNGSYLVKSYVTAFSGTSKYGFWERTLGVVTTGSTPTVSIITQDFDDYSTGFVPNQIVYTPSTGNTIDVYISGLTAENLYWESYYDIIGNSCRPIVNVVPSSNLGSFGVSLSNGNSDITIGQKGYVKIPYPGIITSWTIMTNTNGSIILDVWKDVEANFPPTSGDSITNSNYPNLTNQIINSDNILSGWTTNFLADDIFAFNVLGVTGVTNINLTINVTKT